MNTNNSTILPSYQQSISQHRGSINNNNNNNTTAPLNNLALQTDLPPFDFTTNTTQYNINKAKLNQTSVDNMNNNNSNNNAVLVPLQNQNSPVPSSPQLTTTTTTTTYSSQYNIIINYIWVNFK
eukprot:UN09361